MPFKSAKQRRLFFAARGDPAIRKRMGLTLGTVNKLIREDKKKPRS